MITEDDKKAAEIHASRVCPGEGPEFCVWSMSKQDFLAGVAYARKPHVVADGDLPKEDQKVLIQMKESHTKFNKFMVAFLDDRGYFVSAIECPFPDFVYKNMVEYWWPLPEVSE